MKRNFLTCFWYKMGEHVWAVVFAVFTFFMMRFAITPGASSPESNFTVLPGLIVMVAVVLILLDTNLIPRKYSKYGPKFAKMLIEGIMAVFILDTSMLLIWSNIELLIVTILKMILMPYYGDSAETFASVILTCLALAILIFAMNVTKNMEMVMKKFRWGFAGVRNQNQQNADVGSCQ